MPLDTMHPGGLPRHGDRRETATPLAGTFARITSSHDPGGRAAATTDR